MKCGAAIDDCDKSSDGWKIKIFLFGFFLFLSLVFQIQSGAWQGGFGKHADEGAHVVTSLMIRDYLWGGFREQPHPVRFAEDYYSQFPKVAIGHYPPFLYLVIGLFLIPFRTPESALIAVAAVTAGAAWLTWLSGRRMLRSGYAAVAMALAVCLLPLIRAYTATVMADVLLLGCCLASVLSFSSFLRKGRVKYSLLFGIFATLAILTKGSGIMLAVVPPVAIAVTGRWALWKSWRLWVSVVPVLLIAIPWTLATYEMAAGGFSELEPGSYLLSVAPLYLHCFGSELSWVVLLCFAFSLVFFVFSRMRNGRRAESDFEPEVASHLGLVFGVFCIIAFVPSGFEPRYLIPLSSSVFLLAGSFVEGMLGRRSNVARNWGGVALAFLIVLETWRPVDKVYTGVSESVRKAVSDFNSKRDHQERIGILIVSNARGEGAVTAEATFHHAEKVWVLRSSQILADSDWMGRGYEIAFKTVPDLRRILRENLVDYLLIDRPDEDSRHYLQHWEVLNQWIESGKDEEFGELIEVYPSRRRNSGTNEFRIYRVMGT
ncbi:MAG: glycosyltransferase family 39 protein [Verrucomicrobiales bacterium]|nr:glycosyltransferase family 39 protein [Verrucomicrobiales bacterium]